MASQWLIDLRRHQERERKARAERMKRRAKEEKIAKRQRYLDDIEEAREDASKALTKLQGQQAERRRGLQRDHEDIEGSFNRARSQVVNEHMERTGEVLTNKQLERMGLGDSQLEVMRERANKQLETFDEQSKKDLERIKEVGDAIATGEPSEKKLERFQNTLRNTAKIVESRRDNRRVLTSDQSSKMDEMIRKRRRAISQYYEANGRNTDPKKLAKALDDQGLGDDDMESLVKDADKKIAAYDKATLGDDEGRSPGSVKTAMATAIDQLNEEDDKKKLKKHQEGLLGQSTDSTKDMVGAGDGKKKEVADDQRHEGKGVQIKFPDTKDTIQSPEMFEAAYMMGVGTKISGAYAAFEESSWEQDNRIRTAEINEMMLDYEAADLEENYADRMNIIAQRGAQQAGEMKAAAAAGGIDIDSISAQQGAAAQRQVTADDLDAIRSQVVAARRGIHIRKANLGIEKQAAKMQGSLERTKAITGGLLDLGKDYFDFQSVVPKNKEKEDK